MNDTPDDRDRLIATLREQIRTAEVATKGAFDAAAVMATENASLREHLAKLGDPAAQTANRAWLAEFDRLRARITQLESQLTTNPT